MAVTNKLNTMATVKKIKKAQSGKKVDSATMAEVKAAFKNFGPDSARIAKEHWAKEAKIKDSIKASKSSPKQKNGGATAKDGKWIQKATASIKRRGTEGKCTPITKPGCTGKAKTLAMTFKKMAKAKKGK